MKHKASIQVHGRVLEVVCPTVYMLGVHLMFLGRAHYINFMRKVFGTPKYVVDVGANTGFYTSMFKFAWPEAKVLSIEPSSYNFPYLVYNTKSFQNVEYTQVAAHSINEMIQIALPLSSQRSKNQKKEITSAHISVYGESNELREEVVGKPLDGIVDDKVDILKIDVEGHEMPVLYGTTDILKNHRPILLVECTSANLEMVGRTREELTGFIEGFDYREIGCLASDLIFIPVEKYDNFLC